MRAGRGRARRVVPEGRQEGPERVGEGVGRGRGSVESIGDIGAVRRRRRWLEQQVASISESTPLEPKEVDPPAKFSLVALCQFMTDEPSLPQPQRDFAKSLIL